MSQRKLIVFDLDDTIYDQSWPFIQAFHDCFHYELDLDELYLDSRKVNNLNYNKVLDHSMTIEELGCLRIEEPLRKREIYITQDQALQFQHRYAYYQGNLLLSDTMKDIFDELKTNHIEIAILSNGLSASQMHKINGLKLNRWFEEDHIFISEKIGYAKPDPQAFTYIEKKLDYCHESCIYIGDSYTLDILSALKAVWKAVYINKRGYIHSKNTDVIEIYSEEELRDTLRKITGDQE